MVVFSSIGNRFCNEALNDLKAYLLPSRLRFQCLSTLLLRSGSKSVKVYSHSNEDSGIIQINMDRPEAMNALGNDMLRGLMTCFEDIRKDSDANVLMICSSVSRVFCAGADLKEGRDLNVSAVRAVANSLRSTFSFLEALQIPTIAVIEGEALGGGLEMALSCDFRICGEDAKLSLPETGLAIIPAAGGTQRLPRLVGKSIAKELIFTGRKISARDALSFGLVNYCVPAGQAFSKALEVARDINKQGSVAIKMVKQAINEDLEENIASALSVEEDS